MEEKTKKQTLCIGVVCDYSSIYSGNFIPTILSLAIRLGQNHDVVFLFPLKAKNRKWIELFTNHNFKVAFFRKSKIEFIRNLRHYHKEFSFDLIYFHFVSPALGKAAFVFKHVRLCFHIHSDFNGGKKAKLTTRFKLFIFDKFIKRNSVYIFVSKDLFNYSHAAIKYHVHNGLARSSSFFEKATSVTSSKDPKIHLPINKKECLVFLAFAWSPYVKGIDVLCKAFNKFNINNNSYLLLVHRRDDGEKELISFLSKNQIDMTNIFLLPPIENVAYYYSLCSCFVSSSRSEGFSYSVLEAIALNKNVIISNIPGTSWASKFNYVYEYECENVESLVKSMKQVSLTQRNEEKESLNAKLLKEYDISVWVDRVVDIFKEQKIFYE